MAYPPGPMRKIDQVAIQVMAAIITNERLIRAIGERAKATGLTRDEGIAKACYIAAEALGNEANNW